MDKMKGKVGEFLHKSGKHDTTVHESVNSAVTHETVKPHQHENVTTAVDREVHQDHHHTSVQPVHDRQVLPEQHHERDLGTEHREVSHGDNSHVQDKLRQEAARFKDERHVTDTTTSRETNPVVTGEHTHHHVHEAIQPVVHRETVEPHVVHSLAKVHEKHDNPAQVHESSTLPAMNMSDFKSQGGSLTGRETRSDHFGGEPRHIGGTHAGTGETPHGLDTSRNRAPDTDPTAPHNLRNHGVASQAHTPRGFGTDKGEPAHSTGTMSSHDSHGTHGTHGSGLTGSGHTGTHDTHGTHGTGLPGTGHSTTGHSTTGHTGTGLPGTGHSTTGHSTTGHSTTGHTGTGLPGTGHSTSGHTAAPGVGTTGTHSGVPGTHGTHDPHSTHNTSSTTGHGSSAPAGKPSLMDKLNPKVDATGDGKAGFMK